MTIGRRRPTRRAGNGRKSGGSCGRPHPDPNRTKHGETAEAQIILKTKDGELDIATLSCADETELADRLRRALRKLSVES